MAARWLSGKQLDGVFWTSQGTSKESIVPGVNDIHNLRPKVKGGRTKEVKASIPVVQSVIQVLDPHATKSSISGLSTMLSDSRSNVPGKQVSLRDLCVEDKKRVATLIKELAKLGEEKENAEKNLEEERKHYEEQILKLVEQQEQILKEREEVQNRLLEYETYILRLQQDQKLSELKQKEIFNKQVALGQQVVSHPIDQHDGHHNNQAVQQLPEACHQENMMTKTPNKVPKQLVEEEEEESFFGNCSTNVLPSHSVTAAHHDRPFTAKLNKELDHQNQILAASFLSGQSTPRKGIAANSPRALNRVNDSVSPEDILQNSFRASSPKNLKENEKGSIHVNLLQGYGNTDYLTPEKNDLIHRLIESQSQLKAEQVEVTDLNTNIQVAKRKPRKRPPPSYGPLHPPVMSSTQKSSEFGEVDSLLTLDQAIPEQKLWPPVEVEENRNNNSDDMDRNSVRQPVIHGKGALSTKYSSKTEEKSTKELEIARLEEAGIDQEFLRKYKKMTPSERKQELLRQRSMLLEEQNRLKILLAEQESQLKLKEKELAKKKNTMADISIHQGKKQINLNARTGQGHKQVTKEAEVTITRSPHVDNKGHNSPQSSSKGFKSETKGLNNSCLPVSKDKGQLESSFTDATDKKLNGRDGDQCILYTDLPAEQVVKKLDYSQSSDTESIQSSGKLKSKRGVAKEVIDSPGTASLHRDHPNSPRRSTLQRPQMDKSTSISYAHVPRLVPSLELDDKPNHRTEAQVVSLSSPGSRPDTERSSKKLSSAVGDKTMSVVEIINTLSDKTTRNSNSKRSASNNSLPSSNKSDIDSDGSCRLPSTDRDPNLSLFILNRNLTESKARRNLVSKYNKPAVDDYCYKLSPRGHRYEHDLLVDQKFERSEEHRRLKKKQDQPDLEDEIDNVLVAIENLEGSEGSEGPECELEDDLTDLEESRILEDVFFI
ncbi:protein hinderin [Biomphalaria glabrata]|nr:protein hinderin-like isoform X1 [Biomphalaria glabrata]